VIAGGAAVAGQGARDVRGVPTSGTIPMGGRVEREVNFDLSSLNQIRLALRVPDFTTAALIEQQVNRSFNRAVARMTDPGTVIVDVTRTGLASAAHALAQVENILITPQTRARVVVDQRSGTIVIGEDVRISRVAVAQGGLTLRVEEAPVVEQPNPFAAGETIIVPRTQAMLDDRPPVNLAELSGATSLSEIVSGLNALGVSPRDMIDILNSIKAAGALHAELIVQ
ncbi:MAG: flagellar basal body P-ring protein FlgI, partial [Roseinatronobacter sp.]